MYVATHTKAVCEVLVGSVDNGSDSKIGDVAMIEIDSVVNAAVWQGHDGLRVFF